MVLKFAAVRLGSLAAKLPGFEMDNAPVCRLDVM